MKKKEAIELLESYENKLVYEISEKDKIAIKTVLNLIEKPNKRINELEKALIDDNYKHRKEIEKKDKIIDEMADWISEYKFLSYDDFCSGTDKCYSTCKPCVIKYFEKKEEE